MQFCIYCWGNVIAVQSSVAMHTTNMLLLSAITLLLAVDCLALSPRNRRQSANDEDPECRPSPPSGQDPPKPPPKCCNIPVILALDFTKCQSKEPQRGPPPAGSAPPSGPPPSDGHEKMGCYIECVFNSTGLLNADGSLNKDVIMKKLDAKKSELSEWSVGLSGVSSKCFDTSANKGLETQCKSGAMEFMHCTARQLFLNCPSSVWTSSDECTQIKAKVEKCPRMPIPLADDKN